MSIPDVKFDSTMNATVVSRVVKFAVKKSCWAVWVVMAVCDGVLVMVVVMLVVCGVAVPMLNIQLEHRHSLNTHSTLAQHLPQWTVD